MPAVLLAISGRLERETTPEQAAALWGATRILMGLRYEEEQVDAIIEGVSAMLFGIRGIEESSVYQGILRRGEAKGRAEGRARGRCRAGEGGLAAPGPQEVRPPDERVQAELSVLGDLERLNKLIDRILDVSSWDDLLGSL